MKKNKLGKKDHSANKPLIKQYGIRVIITLFALLLYANTTSYEYTLDDNLYFTRHEAVQKGIAGIKDIFTKPTLSGAKVIQPYRPVMLLSFAIEKSLFKNKSAISHFINVLLYIFLLQVLFSLLSRLLPQIHSTLLLLIVLIYAAHPIHSEVVASVKSRDELLAALFGSLAWLNFIKLSGKENNQLYSGLGLVYFALALFSKESAIALLPVLPLSAFCFKSTELKQALRKVIPYFILSIAYLAIRQLVIGNQRTDIHLTAVDNIIFGVKNFQEATGTRMEILYYYLKLLVIPWPLSYDYSYNYIPIVDWGNILPWVSLIIHLSLAGLTIYYFRKRPIVSFSVLFYFIMSSPANNVFIINGTTLGERLLFFPSLGYVLLILYSLATFFKIDLGSFNGSRKPAFIMLTACLLLIFSGLTLVRSADWKSNSLLFEQGVITAPNSSLTHSTLGTFYLEQAQSSMDSVERDTYLKKAIGQFEASLNIYPDFISALSNLANCYYYLNDMQKAINYFTKVTKLDPNTIVPFSNLAVIYEARQAYDSSIYYYNIAYKNDSANPIRKSNLANIYFEQGVYLAAKFNRIGSIDAFKQCLEKDENNLEAIKNIAISYDSLQLYDSALVYMKFAYLHDTSNLQLIQNIAIQSNRAKQYEQSIEFANKALKYQLDAEFAKTMLNVNMAVAKNYELIAGSYSAMGKKEEALNYKNKILELSGKK